MHDIIVTIIRQLFDHCLQNLYSLNEKAAAEIYKESLHAIIHREGYQGPP
jgi:hypothetical protein